MMTGHLHFTTLLSIYKQFLFRSGCNLWLRFCINATKCPKLASILLNKIPVEFGILSFVIVYVEEKLSTF